MIPRALAEERGSSLVEVTVALALLLSVLLPLSASAIYLLQQQRSETTIHTLTLGRQVMEETLHHRTFTSETFTVQENSMQVEKTVRREGDRIVIRVTVYPVNRADEAVTFMTVRTQAPQAERG